MKYFVGLIFLIYSNTGFGQFLLKGIITSDHDVQLNVFEPYEGTFYDHDLATKSINVTSNKELVIPIVVKTATFFKITFDGVPFFIYAQPNDSLYFNATVLGDTPPVNTNWIHLTGSNAEGILLFNNQFNYPYPISKFTPIFNLFEQKNLNIPELKKNLITIINTYTHPYDSLYLKNKITESFRDAIKVQFKTILIDEFLKPFIRKGIKEIHFISADISKANILQMADEIQEPFNISVLKCVLAKFYVSSYLCLKYMIANKLETDNEIKDSTFKINNNTYIFSNTFVPSLYAPDDIKTNLIGDYMIGAIILFPESVTKSDLTIFNHLAPNNYYLTYLQNKYHFNNTQANIGDDKNISFIDTTKKINNINDLIALHKGKRLYIDIWATWCAPCIQEFNSYKFIDSALFKLKVNKLFISIDSYSNYNNWMKTAKKYSLDGVHLIANKNLIDNIQEKIYGKNSFEIPRYIIVNENGQILNLKAERPSSGGKLITELNNYFK
jgi:thiol-disulfide isomerase/thioredoxin